MLSLAEVSIPKAVEGISGVGVGLFGVYFFPHGEGLFVASNGLGVLALFEATVPRVAEDLYVVCTWLCLLLYHFFFLYLVSFGSDHLLAECVTALRELGIVVFTVVTLAALWLQGSGPDGWEGEQEG